MFRQKTFIIKADDYGRNAASIDPWRRFFDLVLEYNFIASVGVVTSELSINPAVARYLRSMHEEYDIELWNHSHTHRNLCTLSDAVIKTEIEQSQDIFKYELGVVPTIMGAPFNKVDQRSANTVLKTGCFKGYYAFDGLVDESVNINSRFFCSTEVGTERFKPLRFDEFKKNATLREWPSFLVLQVHPYYWTKDSFENFGRVLSELDHRGYNSVSALTRLEYSEIGFSRRLPCVGRSMADNICHEDSVLAGIDNGQMNSNLRSDTPYYLRMLGAGTGKIYVFLRKIGFHDLPLVDGKRHIVDIGAGAGNWSAACALLPNATVTAVDIDETHLSFLKKSLIAPSPIKLLAEDVFDADLQTCGVSAVVCNNTLNYLPIVSAMKLMQRVLVLNGKCLIGVQNRLYPIKDAISATRQKNVVKAIGFLERFIDSEGERSGSNTNPSIRYFNSDEFNAIALACGLKLLVRHLDSPLSFGNLFGFETFSTYLCVKTHAAQRLMQQELIDSGLANHLCVAARVSDINLQRELFYGYCERLKENPRNDEALRLDMQIFNALGVFYKSLLLNDEPMQLNCLKQLEIAVLDMKDEQLAYWL